MEEIFWKAAKNGHVQVVKEILSNIPNLNVNWVDKHAQTALSIACESGHDSIVSILLAHPDTDVNLKNIHGQTPFLSACYWGYSSCARLLLKDSRVLVTESDRYGCTPLWRAAFDGHVDPIKWWIASAWEMDLGDPGDAGFSDAGFSDAIGAAKMMEDWNSADRRMMKKKALTLLERFKEDPNDTRHQVRLEIGWYDELAAEVFALVVFVSDGLLQINDTTTTTPAARFFNIARRLPLELQMVLCFLQVGSPKETIQGKDSEVAFKSLAEKLLWSSFFTT